MARGWKMLLRSTTSQEQLQRKLMQSTWSRQAEDHQVDEWAFFNPLN